MGRMERAFDSNQYSLLGVFFDIEGAFDNTPMKSVNKVLANWKVPTMIRSWIIAMLSQCIAQVSVGSVQGDHLSGKPGNMRELYRCQGNLRNFTKSHGNVGELSGKNLVM